MFVGNERKIPMSRVNLLNSLQITLADHKIEVGNATEAWQEAAKAFAEDLLERVNQGDYTNLSFTVACPVDNSKEINRAIRMVECSVEDVITLDESTFNQWVLGEWGFRGHLNAIMMAASGMTASLRKK